MLIKYSHQQKSIVGDIKEKIKEESCNEERIGDILRLCPTRWTVRAACYERILANHASLFKLWEVCLEKRTGATSEPELSAVNDLTSSVRERFNQPAFKMNASLEALLLKAANGECTSKEVDDWASKYSGDVNVNSLVAQLSTFHVLTTGVRLRYFKDILTKFKGLKPKARQFIDNVIVVCKSIHVNPATSTTGEWPFSTARRIKTRSFD